MKVQHHAPPQRGEELRRVMGHYPTGVVAVTALREGRPVGLVIGSFFSVSLQPPLIGFGVARSSTSWPLIHTATAGGIPGTLNDTFGVNILAADQAPVSAALSVSGHDKFTHLDWYPSDGGSPVIRGALAHLECRLEVVHNAGDHLLVLARVLDLRHLRAARPLVFYRRGYWTLDRQSVLPPTGPASAARHPSRAVGLGEPAPRS
jgi:3-hydroxy-9,10-secoandrosta-1,3,5(10)-triene-9,17-dione monooxygenase reductase component